MNTTMQVMNKKQFIEVGLFLSFLLFSRLAVTTSYAEKESVTRKYCDKSLTGYQLSLL